MIGTTGTETRFLSEGDLPEHARLNRQLSGMDVDEDRQLAEALAKSAEENSGALFIRHAALSKQNCSQKPPDQSFNWCVISLIGAGKSSANASSSPPNPESSQQKPSTAPASTFPEADIKKLMEYGFSRNQAEEELTRARGNVDQALAALFAKSFKMPS